MNPGPVLRKPLRWTQEMTAIAAAVYAQTRAKAIERDGARIDVAERIAAHQASEALAGELKLEVSAHRVFIHLKNLFPKNPHRVQPGEVHPLDRFTAQRLLKTLRTCEDPRAVVHYLGQQIAKSAGPAAPIEPPARKRDARPLAEAARVAAGGL